MDSGTKRRLILGLVSSWISKMAASVIQLIQVPFFLHFWSEAVFGEWLIISSIPSFLSFSDVGFGTVAGNEMTMAEARGERETSLRVFQSCWWLIILAMCALGIAVATVLLIFPVTPLLNIHSIRDVDARWIIGFLGASILFGQLEQLLQSAYRSIGRNPYGSFVKSSMSLGAFAAMLIPVSLGYGPRTTAMVFASANILGTLLLAFLVRNDIPWIRFGWKYARLSEIKRLSPLAFAFLGFPMGNALNLQGTLQAVSYALGPLAVVVFATARTVSRVALQMVQMINSTYEPEFSRSFARGDLQLVRTLHRRACQMALIISFAVVGVLSFAGPYFLHHWTQGKVPPSRPLLMVMLLVVILYSLWSTSSGIMYATNQHRKLSAVYLGATGITVLITFIFARLYGLYGAAASLLVSEILMNIYVLPSSLNIAHDTLPNFLRTMLTIPTALHPRVLVEKFRTHARP
jgi:O-antigen/teichoic acid export membrane protein